MAIQLRTDMVLSARAIFLCKLTHPEISSFPANEPVLDAVVDELSSLWASNQGYSLLDHV